MQIFKASILIMFFVGIIVLSSCSFFIGSEDDISTYDLPEIFNSELNKVRIGISDDSIKLRFDENIIHIISLFEYDEYYDLSARVNDNVYTSSGTNPSVSIDKEIFTSSPTDVYLTLKKNGQTIIETCIPKVFPIDSTSEIDLTVNPAEVSTLVLGHIGSEKIIDILSKFTQITNLYMYLDPSNYSIFDSCQLPELHFLGISIWDNIEDFSFLRTLTNLKELMVNGKDILSLEGLENLKQLNALNIRQDSGKYSFVDTSPMKSLENLYYLNIENCKGIDNLDFLNEMSELTYLNMAGCKDIQDYTPLSDLSKLHFLDVSSCNIDGKIFYKLFELEVLITINNQNLKNTSDLSGLSNLTVLNLIGCKNITDFEALTNLTKINILALAGNDNITSLDFINGMNNLIALNLHSCDNLFNIQALSRLSKLRTLALSRCLSLTDISPLKKLNLNILKIQNNPNIYDFSPLAYNKQLKKLNISDCQIKDFSFLGKLNDLNYLDLSSNTSLTDLESLEKMVNLVNLHLSNCSSLQNINGLRNMSSIEFLSISGSPELTDIEILSKLKTLKTLHLYNTGVTDFSPLDELKDTTIYLIKSPYNY